MKLINENCIKAMETMPENFVDSIITDPPYELGFMGKSWDFSGIAFNVEVWKEALRVLKPGGHLIAFSGSRTYHRMAVAIENAGFQIRDQIMWIYSSGFPKSHNLQGDWDGWGTALKPAHEPMVLARKPLIGTVANNVLTYGVGGLNIDASRVGNEERTYGGMSKNKPDVGTFRDDNWVPKDISVKVEGRWPANIIHDGSDEVVEYFGQPARFFYCAKASKRDRNEGLDGVVGKEVGAKGNGLARKCATCSASVLDGCDCPDRTFVNPVKANHHPTVKPTDLMRYLCKMVTPPKGIILDPFMGSGSTGKAAVLDGFDFIGIEQSEEYVKISEERIKWAKEQYEGYLL
jgi:site-specific DNA-methyltransferase (adenine-specific)